MDVGVESNCWKSLSWLFLEPVPESSGHTKEFEDPEYELGLGSLQHLVVDAGVVDLRSLQASEIEGNLNQYVGLGGSQLVGERL